MSWKTSGKLLSGPPTSSNSNKLDPRFKPNLGGLNAFQREQQLVGRYGGREVEKEVRRSEWDVLKENHRFIRDDEEPGEVSWEERLARAYESKLFKEFALIDLKHFKSRRLALRWRTAEEVVSGIGEETCASLRCKYHDPHQPTPRNNHAMWEGQSTLSSTPGRGASERGSTKRARRMPVLRAFELPFVYEEAGERKEALVKVRLCARCQGKLTWKPGRSERGSGGEEGSGSEEEEEEERTLTEEERRRRSDRENGGGGKRERVDGERRRRGHDNSSDEEERDHRSRRDHRPGSSREPDEGRRRSGLRRPERIEDRSDRHRMEDQGETRDDEGHEDFRRRTSGRGDEGRHERNTSRDRVVSSRSASPPRKRNLL